MKRTKRKMSQEAKERAAERAAEQAKKRRVRIIVTVICIVLGIILLAAASYLAYIFIAFHRIGSKEIPVVGGGTAEEMRTGEEYKIVSYNIGFGAYESDYGFFMDGGRQSWAWSEERLDANLKHIASFLKKQEADLTLVQEVDIDADRSYHFDEREYLIPSLQGEGCWDFAQNYDSPYLFYPFYQPHGASKAGLMTFSDFPITEAQRVELPIESGFTKFLDLDRCYSKSRIPVDGRELVLYNLHLSAYTSDGTIANEQLKLLLDDMEAEYAAGNWCIAGGDFNKDLLGDSSVYFGKADKDYTWAQPIPAEILSGYHASLVAPLDEANPVPSCRNADGPYHEGQFVLTIDGFLVSDNVSVAAAEVIDTGFAYSDHNPVAMRFTLE